FLEDHALQIAAPVANDRKLQLSRRALVVKPAVEGDLLTDVLWKVLDASVHKGCGLYRRDAGAPLTRRFAPSSPRFAGRGVSKKVHHSRGTFTNSDFGTIVITSGGVIDST